MRSQFTSIGIQTVQPYAPLEQMHIPRSVTQSTPSHSSSSNSGTSCLKLIVTINLILVIWLVFIMSTVTVTITQMPSPSVATVSLGNDGSFSIPPELFQLAYFVVVVYTLLYVFEKTCKGTRSCDDCVQKVMDVCCIPAIDLPMMTLSAVISAAPTLILWTWTKAKSILRVWTMIEKWWGMFWKNYRTKDVKDKDEQTKAKSA